MFRYVLILIFFGMEFCLLNNLGFKRVGFMQKKLVRLSHHTHPLTTCSWNKDQMNKRVEWQRRVDGRQRGGNGK